MQAILGVLAVTVPEMLLMVSGRKKLGVETSGSSDLAVMQGSGYYQRDKTRWRTLY